MPQWLNASAKLAIFGELRTITTIKNGITNGHACAKTKRLRPAAGTEPPVGFICLPA